MLGSPVNIDIIHESIKINIDGITTILILDTLGDFFDQPQMLINNVMMRRWDANGVFPVGPD